MHWLDGALLGELVETQIKKNGLPCLLSLSYGAINLCVLGNQGVPHTVSNSERQLELVDSEGRLRNGKGEGVKVLDTKAILLAQGAKWACCT